MSLNKRLINTGGAVDTSCPNVISPTFSQSYTLPYTANNQSIRWKSDGSMFFILAGTTIKKFTTSTAFDISTSSYVSGNDLALSSATTSFDISSDGTTIIVGLIASIYRMYEYTLSTAFNPSTGSLTSSGGYWGVPVYDVNFSNDGLQLNFNFTFSPGTGIGNTRHLTLTTAYDMDSRDGLGYTSSIGDGRYTYNADGTKMFEIQNTTNTIKQYSLSTAYDTRTAVDTGISYDVSAYETSPNKCVFNNDLSKMYVVGANSNKVIEYNLNCVIP